MSFPSFRAGTSTPDWWDGTVVHMCKTHYAERWARGCDKSPGFLKEDRGPLFFLGSL